MSNCSDILLQDYLYQQHPDYTYIFDSNTNDFKLRDRNMCIDSIFDILNGICKKIITHYKLGLNTNCDAVRLDQVLYKYSRDVFGVTRLNARVNNLKSHLTEKDRKNLLQCFDYGMKIDSASPYVHRRIAVLFYWLSALKPFSVVLPVNAISKIEDKLKHMVDFHNEYISYIFVESALQPLTLKLNIHDNKDLFYYFLYDLHYRKLSRSSLEAFIYPYLCKSN